jgi:AcrR family transcriptional regulator
MKAGVKPSTRRYHSPVRVEQAQVTRNRVLQAAQRLFVERGYAGTTVAAVAAAAEVSAETVYATFSGKRGLLEGVIQDAIAGVDAAVPRDDPGWWERVQGLSDPRLRLRKMVEHTCLTTARTSAIHAIIRGAADKEPFAVALRAQLFQERLSAQTQRIHRFLKADLRPGLSVSEAGQTYSTLTGPELYHLHTVDLGWKPPRHQAWLTRLLESELLGPVDATHALR